MCTAPIAVRLSPLVEHRPGGVMCYDTRPAQRPADPLPANCHNCGAPPEPVRCSYCGSPR